MFSLNAAGLIAVGVDKTYKFYSLGELLAEFVSHGFVSRSADVCTRFRACCSSHPWGSPLRLPSIK